MQILTETVTFDIRSTKHYKSHTVMQHEYQEADFLLFFFFNNIRIWKKYIKNKKSLISTYWDGIQSLKLQIVFFLSNTNQWIHQSLWPTVSNWIQQFVLQRFLHSLVNSSCPCPSLVVSRILCSGTAAWIPSGPSPSKLHIDSCKSAANHLKSETCLNYI